MSRPHASPRRRHRSPRGEGSRLAEEILDVAGRLLAEAGHPDGVSINDIVSAVGCTPPALYLHFPSKEALVHAVVERNFRGFRTAINDAAAGKEPFDGLQARGLAYVRWGLEHPEAYRVIFLHSPLHNPDAVFGEESNGALQDHISAVQRCIEAGYFPGGDARLIALALWASVHGLASLLLTKQNMAWPEPTEFATLVAGAMCAGLDAVHRAGPGWAADLHA
jgi:AcrR family transcriptional regulator